MARARMPADKPPAWYRFKVGDFIATVVSDGELTFGAPTGEFPSAPAADVNRILDQEFLPHEPMVLQENTLLLDTGDRLIQFDSGFGQVPLFGTASGQYPRNLASTGVTAADIDVVLLTHPHPDHAWGLTDAAGMKSFPNADLYLSKRDFDFWTDEEKLSDPNAGAFVAGARKAIFPYRDRLHLIEEDGEVLPGISAIATPGHTVGHTSFLIESVGERLMYLGDICHHYALLVPHPRWEYLYDSDAKQAVQSRLAMFDRAANERLQLLGYHFPFPGLGRLTREGPESYRYVPTPLSFV